MELLCSIDPIKSYFSDGLLAEHGCMKIPAKPALEKLM
jgi:hypothetical protein